MEDLYKDFWKSKGFMGDWQKTAEYAFKELSLLLSYIKLN